MPRFAISLITACGLSAAAWGRENVASAPPDDVAHLPVFTVSEPRAADFILYYGPVKVNPGGRFRETTYSGPTRMWLTQRPGVNSVSSAPNSYLASGWAADVFIPLRGRGLKSDDEIVRVAGKLVVEMKPGECVKLFYASVNDPKKKSVEVEVQARGEKGVRKVTVTKAPFNEVIVSSSNPVLPFTPLPPPIPLSPVQKSRDAK